ncbi:hypothetical protein Spb1_11190 [Planctopirus ephydatiae]|uniref:DUF2817 domain-containing protein n=1 Tax=Planctopirus ephydatiae TaxID=2528019 RepID=A0A518GKY3_9PLAN|nr:M14 family metallopeptidase [Planctopirus ephydatiae]QDV29239.1 hypothetical protein Spb1_11190 [Planctopirus ephydatiae]
MATHPASTFSPDHAAARQRFQQSASRLGWRLESYSIGLHGPTGEELEFDVAISQGEVTDKVLVVSSGLHGVEGFFGSAVQVACMEHWLSTEPPNVKCVFLHGLNPYGFTWLRRFDESNVDPNRNFLLPGEHFEGAPDGYQQLDRFLNPRHFPSSWEPFTLKALWLITRYGMPALRQSIAGGQYTFPQGLFFGGDGPSRSQQILREHMPRWLNGCRQVVHLDFHTGLGRFGTHKLLIDYPLNEAQRNWFSHWFGTDSFEAIDSAEMAYEARGGFGRWCTSQGLAANYLFACAEFGTYGGIQVLAGLRAENQAHHWGSPNDPSTIRAKRRLMELFCPASPTWRSQCVRSGQLLIDRALQGLLQS